jgi:TPR repeat protein
VHGSHKCRQLLLKPAAFTIFINCIERKFMPLFRNLTRIIFFVSVTITTVGAWAALTPEQGDELFQQATKQALKGEANAIRQLNTAALSGDGVAQLYLGKLYGYGVGVPRDDVQAAQWFRKAAEQGNVEAQYQVGLGFFAGIGLAQDDGQAAQWFRKAAEQGESGAQFYLGLMYKNGRGVSQDNEQAILWFRKAAEQGSGGAQEQLAKMNAAAGQDKSKAASLTPEQAYALRQKAAQGDTRAAQRIRSAAQSGDAIAQYSLGVMYSDGQGVPQDHAQAVQWYRKAAEQGNADAQFILGLEYANGGEIPQDYAQAERWYRKAIEKNHAEAQLFLGLMYAIGQGVPQDLIAAYALYDISANNNNSLQGAPAPHMRDLIAEQMSPTQIKAGQALTQRMRSGALNALDQHMADASKQSAKISKQPAAKPVSSNKDDGYPTAPAKRPGVVSCNTRCVNGDCWRTYDGGRKVRFRATQKINPLTSQFEWDSGSC